MEILKRWWFRLILVVVILLILVFVIPSVKCGLVEIGPNGVPNGQVEYAYQTLYQYFTKGCEV